MNRMKFLTMSLLLALMVAVGCSREREPIEFEKTISVSVNGVHTEYTGFTSWAMMKIEGKTILILVRETKPNTVIEFTEAISWLVLNAMDE